ncbi:hypothetical protein [Flagellimonas okinawensis]|uniref:SCP domain-containing protein n=1 Tax=Flagellimonas okinawensis TaxID=3031324 RepID=A0ABT5XT30_9FLAO|nr:hypothetical protein [[Muricauda] okinawensis]MDF0709069.1 hypothetical protein [[Muricauda] okinawensis]
MKPVKTNVILIVTVLGLFMPISVQGQFFKKLKKNVENKIVKKASEKTDEFLNGNGEKTSVPDAKPGPASDNTISQSETADKKDPVAVNDHNVLTFKATSKDFRDVVIQAHKGLPRYGDVYFLRGTTAPTMNKAYKALLELKFLESTFKDLDQSKLTKHQNIAGDLAKKNSEFAQNHLLILARETLSDEKLQDYFCDSEAKSPCNFYNPAGDRAHVSSWGGNRNNEFAQNRSYTNFIKNHYGTLQAWSNSFYEDGTQIAYFVARGAVAEKYDFKNKGYWIRSIFSIGGDFILHNSNFLAYSENEKTLKNYSKKVFLPVGPTAAKTFNLIERSPVFVVFKVKVTPKITSPNRISWEFELEDTKMEFYKDGLLSQKMGESDIRTIKFKD